MLLVTFLIKEKSDKRPQSAAAAMGLGKEGIRKQKLKKRAPEVKTHRVPLRLTPHCSCKLQAIIGPS